ncbi:dystroglycan-like [Dorcoceras hygrometricum]|uniref:Dystroglycan-like n=1 Tax=Dorcoceras hygrometricum TaxID=472368 RepID=A0A2Z7CUP1_9LAMI|nr:dystroglycan-like [Dorcoceras hygrometricum]
MASSLYSNAQHVDFESVLGMDDPGMVSIFEALMASSLRGFLGCPAVVYEDALVDFFENASVRNGVVFSTVGGQIVQISEKLFAESFKFPVDGLGDLSEMPKDAIFDARSIVSLYGEQINLSGRKNQMKMPYRLLCDIVAKAISVKAGSLNAITVEKFSLMTAVVCGVKMNWAKFLFSVLKKMVAAKSKQAKGFAIQISLLLATFPAVELGEASAFPASKILSKKTVIRFVSINDRDGAEEITGAAKKKAVSKKRTAADIEAAVPKKKRTSKKKSISSISSLEMVSALENVTNLSRTESPRRGGRNKSNHGNGRRTAAGGAKDGGRRGEGEEGYIDPSIRNPDPSYLKGHTACLDWSRREDIQARTVKGRLSWTGRRYQAGTVRGRPNWFGSLLPEVQGTSSWFISWMLEQHEDQVQSTKISSRAELKCRVEAKNAQVQNSSSADQVQCTRAVIECEDRSRLKNQLVKDKPAGQNLQEQTVKEDLSSEDDEACLDWSRREDIQARTVKGRLSWTGRRYQAGTVRGRPNWFGSLLPEVQGTSSWFISWMLEQHEDQEQSTKSSSRAELKCRVEAKNAQVQNSSSADQVQCTRAVIECEDRPAGKSARAKELLQQEERLALGAHLGRGRICMLVGHPSSLFQLKMVHLRKPAWGTAQKQCLLRYRSRLKNQLLKDKPAGQNIQEQTVKEGLSSEDDEACLDWSRREDIQARTVKGRLSWTGRRYQDGTRCTIYPAERPAERPAGKSARAEELLQQEERLALGAHLGRGRICMLVGHPSSLFQLKMVHLRKPAWGTAQKQCLLRYRSRLKNQLVKDKPAGQNLQEQTVKEDLRSEDDEGQLERRSADKRKLEELLKSGCKREEKKRSLNNVKEQPARTKTSSRQIKLMNKLASWLKSNQLR